MKKIYISGPIKDTPDFERLFERAAERCSACGYEPVSPTEIAHDHDQTYESFMREDIRVLLDCDAIYLLKGWEWSNGARVEFLVAAALGLDFFYQFSKDVDLIAA